LSNIQNDQKPLLTHYYFALQINYQLIDILKIFNEIKIYEIMTSIAKM